MKYLMSYWTRLNNMQGWFYELAHNELEKIPPNQFEEKTFFFLVLYGHKIVLDWCPKTQLNNLSFNNKSVLFSKNVCL